MTELKVLHVMASLAPRHGGPTAAALEMVRAVREEGVNASILSTDDDVGGSLNVPLYRWIEYQGLPVYFIPRLKSQQHTLIGYTFAPGFPRWIRRNVNHYDFLHIHTVFSFPSYAAMTGARKLGVPYAVRPLGQLCRWPMTQRSFLKKLQLAVITRRNIDSAAFIHTTSRKETEETAALQFTSRCKTIPHGLNLPPLIRNAREHLRARLGLPENQMLLVYMSRLHSQKGIELLLESFSQLVYDKCDLVVAGMGDERYVGLLRQRVADLGLQKRVHWYGFARGEDKWCLLQGSDVFVLPSYSENFGIAVLEAIACGLPVVISDQVALADEVQSANLGRVVPVEVDAVARAIDELINANDFRTGVKERAIKLVAEQFSWSAAARQLVVAYNECVSPSATTR